MASLKRDDDDDTSLDDEVLRHLSSTGDLEVMPSPRMTSTSRPPPPPPFSSLPTSLPLRPPTAAAATTTTATTAADAMEKAGDPDNVDVPPPFPPPAAAVADRHDVGGGGGDASSANSGAYDRARAAGGGGDPATRMSLLVTAVLIDMTSTTPSSALVRALNDDPTMGGGAGSGGGSGGGTNDAIPDGLARRVKFGMIGLTMKALVAVGAIIAGVVVVMQRPDPVPVPIPRWKQLGATIERDLIDDRADRLRWDRFGTSVALSADASILAIGAPGYIDNIGFVKVFRVDDDGGNWVQLGQTIFGDNAYDDFGISVDISPDGMTIICGSPQMGHDYDSPGYVRVFSLEGDSSLGTDNWKKIGEDIIDEANTDSFRMFGHVATISSDGKTIAVYAHGNIYVNTGHVRIYRQVANNGASWEQIGQDIRGEATEYQIGTSVSLSADGSIVVIGAAGGDYNGDESGQVTVYRYDGEGSSWERLGQSIYGHIAGDWFGTSVDLSLDGNTLAISSPGKDENDRPGSGYVRVFSLTNGDDINNTDTWNQIGQDILGDANGDAFGLSVSLSDDGQTLAVSARAGYVRIYRMDDVESNWIQIGDDIDEEYSFWRYVSLSADGSKVAIGTPYSQEGAGRARVFALE
jgi:hypothetical protein